MAHSLTRRTQLCFTLMICSNQIFLSLKLWKRRLENKFHDLINNGPGKVKTWFHKGHCALVSFSVFFSEATPQGFLSKVTVLKFHKTLWKTPVVDFCFSWEHRPLYLQKMNYAVCFPWNFEAGFSRSVFGCLLYPKAATKGDL